MVGMAEATVGRAAAMAVVATVGAVSVVAAMALGVSGWEAVAAMDPAMAAAARAAALAEETVVAMVADWEAAMAVAANMRDRSPRTVC